MKKQLVMFAIAGAALVGCDEGVRGSGVAKTQLWPMDSWDKLSLSGWGDAQITIGEPAMFKITADDNLLPLIESKVVDGRLIVRPTVSISPVIKPTFEIRVPSLVELRLAGATHVDVGDLVNDHFTVDAEGVATVTVRGRTDELSIRLDGSGAVKAFDLEARAVDVKVSGAADAEVHATELLDATALGASDVRYRGSPKVTRDVAGVGKITKVE